MNTTISSIMDDDINQKFNLFLKFQRMSSDPLKNTKVICNMINYFQKEYVLAINNHLELDDTEDNATKYKNLLVQALLDEADAMEKELQSLHDFAGDETVSLTAQQIHKINAINPSYPVYVKEQAKQIVAMIEEKFLTQFQSSEDTLEPGWKRLPQHCMEALVSNNFFFTRFMEQTSQLFEVSDVKLEETKDQGLKLWHKIIYQSVFGCIQRQEGMFKGQGGFYFPKQSKTPHYIYSSNILSKDQVDQLIEASKLQSDDSLNKFVIPGIMTGNVSEKQAL